MSKVSIKPQGFMVPLPVVMLTCVRPGETPNIITMSWVGVLCSEPPLIGVGIRPERFSYDIVKTTGEFVINVPNEGLARATDYCGYVSGRDKDKFKECKLTAIPASEVNSPLIQECPVNIECRVTQSLMLGTHELFIGEILAIHVDEECLDNYSKLDITKAAPFVYVPGASKYVGGLSKLLGSGGFSLKK